MKITEYERKILLLISKHPNIPMGGDKSISGVMACRRLMVKGLLVALKSNRFVLSHAGKAYMETLENCL